jgi:hypothetical protein
LVAPTAIYIKALRALFLSNNILKIICNLNTETEDAICKTVEVIAMQGTMP